MLLVLEGVAPDASYQTPGASGMALEGGPVGAVRLLDTERSVVAVLRAAPGMSRHRETERLRLSSFVYIEAKQVLSAWAAPIPASELPAELKRTIANTDADGKFPAGPVQLIAVDTDTASTDAGAPIPPSPKTSSTGFRSRSR